MGSGSSGVTASQCSKRAMLKLPKEADTIFWKECKNGKSSRTWGQGDGPSSKNRFERPTTFTLLSDSRPAVVGGAGRPAVSRMGTRARLGPLEGRKQCSSLCKRTGHE
jgi:hypothetical protein